MSTNMQHGWQGLVWDYRVVGHRVLREWATLTERAVGTLRPSREGPGRGSWRSMGGLSVVGLAVGWVGLQANLSPLGTGVTLVDGGLSSGPMGDPRSLRS